MHSISWCMGTYMLMILGLTGSVISLAAGRLLLKDKMGYPYIFICIMCGISFALIYKSYGSSPVSAVYMLLIFVLTVIALNDMKNKLIPDKLVAACFLTGLVSVWVNDKVTIASGAAGCLLCGGIIFLASLITKGGVGLGDAKLIAALGMGLGLEGSAAVLILSAVISGLFGLGLLIINLENRKRTIPFAPFVLAAAIFVLTGL